MYARSEQANRISFSNCSSALIVKEKLGPEMVRPTQLTL